MEKKGCKRGMNFRRWETARKSFRKSIFEPFEADYLVAVWQLNFRCTLCALKHSEKPMVGRGKGIS